jgi:hypothetical protein
VVLLHFYDVAHAEVVTQHCLQASSPPSHHLCFCC